MKLTTPRDRVRAEVFDACAAHYIPKHAAFIAGTLLDPIPNAEEEEFRRVGLADFYLAGGMSEGVILAHLADHLNELWGGPCPVSATLRKRGLRLFRDESSKRLRQHEAELWRIQHGVS